MLSDNRMRVRCEICLVHDYEEARKVAEDMNQQQLGLSPRDAAHIVTTSMSIKNNDERPPL